MWTFIAQILEYLCENAANQVYDAHAMIAFSPTAFGMKELLREYEQFSEKYRLKFNEHDTLLIYFMPENLITRGTSVLMNGTVIKMESSCRYLGHVITDCLNGNEHIKEEQCSFYDRANLLARTFNYCSANAKKDVPLILVVFIFATLVQGHFTTIQANACCV